MLDGNSYDITVTWNISASRYYINVYGPKRLWIITVPLISSPPARKVGAAVYDPFLNAVSVTLLSDQMWVLPSQPPCSVPIPGYMKEVKTITNTPPGTMIDYTLENFQPNTYNGKFRALHLNDQDFTIPMPADPGPLIVLGSVSRYLNMVASVFTTSTMIYRNGAFEINP
jgi:hypothetical protein